MSGTVALHSIGMLRKTSDWTRDDAAEMSSGVNLALLRLPELQLHKRAMQSDRSAGLLWIFIRES